jgi:hypothetical protein
MPEFAIYLLNLQWPDLQSPRYRMEDVWPQLAVASLADAPFVLTEYDWVRQEVCLNEVGMARIGPTEARELFQDSVGRAFVVVLHDQRLYGGAFYLPGMPPAIRFPVIHALGEPIELLRIRPGLGGPWVPEVPRLAAQCRAIANPVLEAWLAKEELSRTMPDSRRPPECIY